jgi:hypothetical protein
MAKIKTRSGQRIRQIHALNKQSRPAFSTSEITSKPIAGARIRAIIAG